MIALTRCQRFRNLCEKRDCSDLSAAEQQFLDSHRSACARCAKEEYQFSLALDLLRDSSLETDPSPGFDERLMRRMQVQHIKGSVRYWTPVFLGAAVASLVVLAAVQVVSASSSLPTIHFGGNRAPEARRIETSSNLPNIEFSASHSRRQ